MKYKVLVSDLDGTLLDSKHALNDYTKNTIRKIASTGVKVILATGRHYIDVKGVADTIGLDTCIIASNGTRVYSGDGEKIIDHNMDSEAVEKVLSHQFHPNVHLNIYQGKNWFVFEENKELEIFHQDSLLKYQLIADKSEINFNEVNKFYLYSQDLESLQKEQEYLSEKLSQYCNVFFSYPTVVEVMPKIANKGLALEELMNMNGISSDEVIAFGDALNDFEMLTWVGKALIMGNADENLKAKLPNIEVIDNNENFGVAKYIEKHLLGDNKQKIS